MTAVHLARIAQLEAELHALRGEMQDFTYTVSHDLRASLRHVVSYVHLVQEDGAGQLTPELMGFLQTASDSARHMGLLMDGLVELARLGSAVPDLAPLSLQTLVAEVVSDKADELAARAALRTIHWHVAPDLPAVQADAALLRAALQHVLDNAVKFTAQQPQAVIHISARTGPMDGGAGTGSAAPTVLLTVRDNGAGFNPALRSKLFHPFARLHSVRQFGGIGMGLALTHKIMQRLGGAVEIDAAPDAGCSVCLRVPAAR